MNQAEIEHWAAQFRSQGHEIVSNAADADWVIVNTCSVTAAAASDSREKIRDASRAGSKKIIVTGCWSEMEPDQAQTLENVVRIVPNAEKDGMASLLLGIKPEDFDLEPLKREPLPGIHARTRAFIKVQDGCDNHCTFCVTHIVRGKSRSIPQKEILKEVQLAERSGGNEVVLTGVNLGAWGLDFEKPENLADLLAFLLKESGIPRIRLSSLESWNLSPQFVELWDNPRLCRHFHLPLQSGSETVLKRMARRTTLPEFRQIVAEARRIDPDFAVTTDVIVGFPGETDAEFQQTLDFVREIGFSGGHVFVYSPRPGTAAPKLGTAVRSAVAKERSRILREVFSESRDAFYRRAVGKKTEVLWESSLPPQNGLWEVHGLTGNYLSVRMLSDRRIYNVIQSITPKSYDGQFLST